MDIPNTIPFPLARCRPGPAHAVNDRHWYGHLDRVNPATGMFEFATFTLRREPGPTDTHWMHGTAVSLAPPIPPLTWEVDPLGLGEPDLSELGELEHPSLSAAARNPSMVGP